MGNKYMLVNLKAKFTKTNLVKFLKGVSFIGC